GFNGKERDNNMGVTTQYDYGFRIYNPSIGKFLSVDPLTSDYASWSPYPFAMNRPIDGVDLDGLEYESSHLWQLGETYGINPSSVVRDGLDGAESLIWMTFEGFLSHDTQGKIIRDIHEKQGITLSNEIPDSELGRLFTIRFDNGHATIKFDPPGAWDNVADVGISGLDVAAVATRSKVTGVLAKSPAVPGLLKAAKTYMPAWVYEGIKYENDFFAALVTKGETVFRRVSFEAIDADGNKVRAVVDGIVKNDDGSLDFIETKLRSTTNLTKNQKVVYEALENGTAKAVGENAKDAGFKIGEKVQAKVRRENKYNVSE
ncbi:MAG: hypothetical protein JXR03_21160, partial [Cyclobacteriaceae bacterium]